MDQVDIYLYGIAGRDQAVVVMGIMYLFESLSHLGKNI